MEDRVYDYNNSDVHTCSAAAASSSSLVHNNNNHHPSSSDEISLFLNQILNRSSSASTTALATWTSGMAHTRPYAVENAHRLNKSAGILAVDLVNVSSVGGGYFSGNARGSGANVSSSSFGLSENENTDDHDCESETQEGNEALVGEVPAKPAPPRSSSKRSRAAEVHNLSEKRRRSKINEKMKALQNLIPNSNKTDKASMLDEVIEYLKQLQLQVQMLTLRNGLSLHPMFLPEAMQPIHFPQVRMGFGAEIGSQHMISTDTIVNQENPMQNVFNLPNHQISSNQLQVPNISHIIRSDTSFGLESSTPTNYRPYQVSTSSGETCREDMLLHHQPNVSHSVTNSSGMFPFSTQGSDLKDGGSLESCTVGRNQAGGVHLKNIDRDLVFSPRLAGMQTARSVLSNNMKPERKDLQS